jgi:hypothetical protein
MLDEQIREFLKIFENLEPRNEAGYPSDSDSLTINQIKEDHYPQHPKQHILYMIEKLVDEELLEREVISQVDTHFYYLSPEGREFLYGQKK